MSQQKIGFPAVLDGEPTWRPVGEVKWDRWGGTAPSFDAALNFMDPNAITWPMESRDSALNAARAAAGPWAFNGPLERECEAVLSEPMGNALVTMTTSGSVALGVAYQALMKWRELRGLPLTEGVPEVIMPAQTFSATATQAELAGLKVVIVDVNEDDLTANVEAIRAAVTRNTVGIVAVALFRSTGPLAAYRQLADEINAWLAIDAAQAPFGAVDEQKFVQWADLVITSFQLGKVLTSGEGGAGYSLIPELAALFRMIIVGKVPDTLPDWWPHGELRNLTMDSVNLRFNEPQAALLLAQYQIYPAQERHRAAQLHTFDELMRDSDLPFRVLSANGDQISYKAGFWNDSRIPTTALMDAYRIQVTGEANPPYVPLCDPASGFNPSSVQWRSGHLGINQDPESCPVATRAHHNVVMLPHDMFLRADGAHHAFDALTTLAAHERELANWARLR